MSADFDGASADRGKAFDQRGKPSDERGKAFDQGRVEVTVNGDVVRSPVWARWKDAVTAWRPEVGAAIASGGVRITDPAGEPVDPDGRVVDGASIRVQTGKESRTG